MPEIVSSRSAKKRKLLTTYGKKPRRQCQIDKYKNNKTLTICSKCEKLVFGPFSVKDQVICLNCSNHFIFLE